MDKRSAVCEYLRKYHRGKQNAIYSRELQRLFCLNERSVRRIVNKLRKDGVPICSSQAGYYYASNQSEINETVCWLNEMLTSASNARTGLLFAAIIPENITINVKLEVSHAQ